MKVKINGKELSLDKTEFDFLFNPSINHNDNMIAWTWEPWNCLDIYLDNFCQDKSFPHTAKEVNENG